MAQKTYSTLAEYEKLTGKKIEKFNEAPSLKTKVAVGEIPPVEERLPQEPMVVEPLEEIGRFGGTLRTGTIGPTIRGFDAEFIRWENLLAISPDLKSVIPSIAKSWSFSEDLKELTVYLRKGMRWSDGAPFTADDFLFWYEDVILNDELTPVKPRIWSPGGELGKVEKINDYTVRFKFAVPYPPVISLFATGQGNHSYAAKHYLKKYHIKYNPKANEIAKKEGYEYWWQCYQFHSSKDSKLQDVDLPTLQPWVLNKIDSYENKYFERNPYYWKVDTSGNQLPYIDKVSKVLIENREIFDLKVIAGEFDVSGRFMPLKNYTLYKEGEKRGNYHTLLSKTSGRTSECTICINHTVKDPVKRKIFNDIRFRQALSLALNRNEINELLFYGRAVPHQNTIDEKASFYEDWMGRYYTEYDLQRANKLLDEIGLDKRDKDGYRLRPDGKTLMVLIETGPWEMYPKMAELAADYWQKVGIKAASKEISDTLVKVRVKANEMDMTLLGFASVTEFRVHANPWPIRPPWGWGPAPWGDWYNSGGKTGEEPPEKVKRLFKAIEEWQESLPGTEEYVKLGKEIETINVKGLYVIGTVGLSPAPVVIKNHLKNAPKEGTFIWDYCIWMPYQPSQWFFEK